MKSAAKASIVVALVFIAGFLSGAGAVSLFTMLRSDSRDDSVRAVFRQGRRPAPAYLNRIERLTEELNLSAGQREQFEPILIAGMEKINTQRRQHRSAVREVLLETRTALRAVLDEQQCKRFDELSPLLSPGSDYRGFGRCLEDEPKQRYRRGSGRGRAAETQGHSDRRTSR